MLHTISRLAAYQLFLRYTPSQDSLPINSLYVTHHLKTRCLSTSSQDSLPIRYSRVRQLPGPLVITKDLFSFWLHSVVQHVTHHLKTRCLSTLSTAHTTISRLPAYQLFLCYTPSQDSLPINSFYVTHHLKTPCLSTLSTSHTISRLAAYQLHLKTRCLSTSSQDSLPIYSLYFPHTNTGLVSAILHET